MAYKDLDLRGSSSGNLESAGIYKMTGQTINAPSTTIVHNQDSELIGVTYKTSSGEFIELTNYSPTVGNETNSVDIPTASTLSNITLYLSFI